MIRYIFVIFIFLLVFSPLAFGTVEAWSLAVMEVLAMAALFLFFLRKVREDHSVLYEVPGIVPLVCLLVFILIQLVPLPASIVKIISPSAFNIYKETSVLSGPDGWMFLTIHRKATLMEFFRMAAYASFYILTVQLLTNKELLKKTVTAIVVFASFLSFFGILQYLLSNNKIYWFRELTRGGEPFGPYVNHNHYAGLMGMLFPLVLSQFLYYKPTITYASLRERVVEIFDQYKTNVYIVLGFFAVLTATTIFLTLSRGAIISLSISMVIFGALLLRSRSSRKRGVIVILIFVLVLLSVGWFGWEPVFSKFGSIRNAQGAPAGYRISIFQDSKGIINDFFLSGSGFGSFSDIYKRYRTIRSEYFIEHVHNDYIELFTDGGIIAFSLAVWFLADVLIKSYRSFRKRKDPYSSYLFIGSAAGISYMLAHSISDFNMHIGANGLFFFFLAGLAVSSANTRLCDNHNKTLLIEKKAPTKQFSISAGVILFACAAFNSGILIAAWYSSSVNGLNSAGDLKPAGDRVKIASWFDPFEAKYPYYIGDIEMQRADMEQAAVQIKKALRLSPVNGAYLQKLGLIYSGHRNYELADRLLQSGIRSDISDPLRYRIYASWLISRGEKQKGLKYIRTGISMEPDKTRTYIALMVLHKISDEEIKSVLPETARPYMQFADYLDKTGKEKMAEDAYIRALGFIRNEKEKDTSYFQDISRFYIKKSLFGEALNIIRIGTELMPGDLRLRLTAADLYEKLEMKDEAVKEYNRVLLIDPGNRQAVTRLEKINKQLNNTNKTK
jgi:O-antigen ligase/tetratricopeptide (TPR) repeat protein